VHFQVLNYTVSQTYGVVTGIFKCASFCILPYVWCQATVDTNILFREQMNGSDSTLPPVTDRKVYGTTQQQRFYNFTEV
jgi:hypothetical protein